MRYLLIFLVIPLLTVEAADTNCARLQKIAGDLEKQIQSKTFPTATCDQMDPVSLGLPLDSIGFPKTAPASATPQKADKSVAGAWDYRCKDLSAINLQLKSIENEIALLKGIDSVKAEIDSGLNTLANYKDEGPAKIAADSFRRNLAVAQSLEKFLATSNSKEETLLGKIAVDERWKETIDQNGLMEIMKSYCGGFPQKDTVCEKGYTFTPDTFNELKDFIGIGAKTEKKFNKKHVNELTEALTINKGQEKYSYNMLAAQLKGLGTEGLLPAEDIKTISELPEISGDKSFSFLSKLKHSMVAIKASGDFVKAKATPERFTSLLNDLINREQWEMKSKLSLVLHQYPSDSAACNSARALEGSIRECLAPLKGFHQAARDDLISEFEYGEKHIAKLKSCTMGTTLEFPEECEGLVSTNMAELVAKSNVLMALKAKHIQASPDLITFRDFALEKLHSGECMSAAESNINQCYDDLGNISKEAITLSGEASDIIYVFQKPTVKTSVQNLCEQGQEVVPFKDELCALKDDEASKKTGKAKIESYQAPVSPDSNNSMGKALFDLGGSLLNSVAGYLAPPMQQAPNLYGPAVFPYSMPPARDGLDYVKQSYPSFGDYHLTPGLMPYSSVNTQNAASSYSFSGSSHFNSPVGW